MQHGDYNADFLCDNFRILSKKSLVFRARLVIGSFFLKLKTLTMCFKLNIFYNGMKDNVYREVYSYKYGMLLPE